MDASSRIINRFLFSSNDDLRQSKPRFKGIQNHLFGGKQVIEQDKNDYEMVDYDDVIVRVTHYVDDGCDWTARIIHWSRQRCYIRMGVCPPLPPAPQVSEPKLIPITKKKKRARKVNDEQ